MLLWTVWKHVRRGSIWHEGLGHSQLLVSLYIHWFTWGMRSLQGKQLKCGPVIDGMSDQQRWAEGEGKLPGSPTEALEEKSFQAKMVVSGTMTQQQSLKFRGGCQLWLPWNRYVNMPISRKKRNKSSLQLQQSIPWATRPEWMVWCPVGQRQQRLSTDHLWNTQRPAEKTRVWRNSREWGCHPALSSALGVIQPEK